MNLFLTFYPQAGAVCCQLTDNNGLYLRFIGTLNRHRRSPFVYILVTFSMFILVMIRKGVAKKLMQRVLEEAKERDVHNIISYVRNDNKVKMTSIAKSTTNMITNLISYVRSEQ